MSGISLYYSKRKTEQTNFSDLLKIVNYHKFSEKEIVFSKIYDDKILAGVVNLDDKKGKPYFFSGPGCDCFLEGSVFLAREIKAGLKKKYSLEPAGDEQYLPFLWKEFKEDSWKHLNGWFNWLIIDHEGKDICLINDRFGMLPCHYTDNAGCLAISSKITPLLLAGITGANSDPCIVLQFIAFNYPVSDSTFIQNVSTLPSASILKISDNRISIKKYWNCEQLLYRKENLLSTKASVDFINETLLNVISRLASRSDKMVVSLTGGWDGRLVLSYLDKLGIKDYFLYSYGSKRNKDILIPQMLSDKLGYAYRPVLLDEEYLQLFNDYALKTLRLSDGLRPISRTPSLYSAEKLSTKANTLLSGNCASNLIKSIIKPSEVYNKNVLRLFAGSDVADTAASIYNEITKNGIFDDNNFNKDEFVESVRKAPISVNPDFDKARKFYCFLLSTVERKYFGTEISSYSHYLKNYSPFIDFEFIDAITKTPFFGGYYKFLTPDKFHTFNVTRLYSKLMKMNSAGLAKYPTDRGFALDDLSTLPGLIRSLYIYWKTKRGNEDQDNFSLKSALARFSFDENKMDESIIPLRKLQKMINNDQNVNAEIRNAFSWGIWFSDLKNRLA